MLAKVSLFIAMMVMALTITGCGGGSPEDQIAESLRDALQKEIDAEERNIMKMSGGGITSVETLSVDKANRSARLTVIFKNGEALTDEVAIKEVDGGWSVDL